MNTVATYNSKRVIVTFAGQTLSGYDDGDFVSIEMDADTFAKKVGADGEVARARTNNDCARATIRLLQTSRSNDLLSAMHAADRAFGTGKGPLAVKDLSGTTLFFAPDAWVVRPPSVSFGREVGSREWALDTGPVEVFVGGN